MQDPTWPLKLADQAAAALAPPKRPAYELIDFGDSKKVVREKLRKCTGIKPYAKTAIHIQRGFIDGVYELKLGDDSFLLYFDFVGDQLYSITFQSEDVKEALFETTAKRAWKSLRDFAVSRFGEPTTADRAPELADLRNGYTARTDSWESNDKEVRLGFAKEKYAYSATLRLLDKELSARAKSGASGKTK